MRVDSFRLGKEDFTVKYLLGFYTAKGREGYNVSAHTAFGSRVVCESCDQEAANKQLLAINSQLGLMELNNFACMGGVILNIDNVAYVDIETTPWEEKKVVATFKNETKLTIGDGIVDKESMETAKGIIASYDEQKSAYRNSPTKEVVTTQEETPIQ